ncbi:hypothetical protein HY04_14430 [Kaistella antarctica]|uniref:Uncharacterized protein n=1 Tax=Kaistella antarctica TaxID=266748 RepID=A0ABR4U075_9FLAO|nr:hypothetical protein HY04_14430 [Kaistella antarctica]
MSLVFGQHEFKIFNPKPAAARALDMAFSTDQNRFIFHYLSAELNFSQFKAGVYFGEIFSKRLNAGNY